MNLIEYLAQCQAAGIAPKFVLAQGQALFTETDEVDHEAVARFADRLMTLCEEPKPDLEIGDAQKTNASE